MSNERVCPAHDADDVVPGRICGRVLPCTQHPLAGTSQWATTKERIEALAIAEGIDPAGIWELTLLAFSALVADARSKRIDREMAEARAKMGAEVGG
jgi:hypothetical protein